MKNRDITNETIFTTNWAEGDRRSVKAALAGKGDARALWWEINRCIHQLFCPNATLEELMFSFHSRHHAITLFFLKFRSDVDQVAAAIRSKGMVAGIRAAASLN
jgi:hypothetical protein